MAKVQRVYLFRTFGLIACIYVASFFVSRSLFVSAQDVWIHSIILICSSAVAAFLGWVLVLRPMGAGMMADAVARQRDFQARFHDMIDNMQDGLVIVTRNDGMIEWNRAALKILDVNERQLRGLEPQSPGWKLLNETGSDMDLEDGPSQQCLKSGIPISGVIGVQRTNGQISWIRVHSSPVFAVRTQEDRKSGSLPKVEMVVTTYRDITQERQALERFELAMKAVRLGVWDWDFINGRMTWDDALCDMYGVDPTSLKRGYDAFESFIVPEDRERVHRTMELAIYECRDSSMEFKIRRSDGETRVIRAESKGFYSREGRALRHVGVNWDVTEQREQELRVLQASKMSSLGEMSAGVAHEINNPLAIIIGKAEAIKNVLQAPTFNKEMLAKHVDVIERTSNRIAKIVKGLRSFSRDGQSDPFEPTNVSEIVNEALAFCQSRFVNNGIEITVSNIAEDLTIDARAVQISQVLLNLLNNAYDAVGLLEEKWVRVEVASDPWFVEFSVTDSGFGIPEEIREKIMQPFFTTKEVGLGTGLGLSIATGIVQAHGGVLLVDSSCPHTRLVVRLPKNQPTTDSGPSSAA